MERERPFFKVYTDDVKGRRFLGWSKGAVFVWLVLKAHENHDTHEAWPSYETISEFTGLADTTISRAIRELVKQGAIRVKKVGRRVKNNEYFMCF